MPLLPQGEIMELLAAPARVGVSFVSGQRVNWGNSSEQYDRRESVYDDYQMYQVRASHVNANVNVLCTYFHLFMGAVRDLPCTRSPKFAQPETLTIFVVSSKKTASVYRFACSTSILQPQVFVAIATQHAPYEAQVCACTAVSGVPAMTHPKNRCF
jgi:hypothetical protein